MSQPISHTSLSGDECAGLSRAAEPLPRRHRYFRISIPRRVTAWTTSKTVSAAKTADTVSVVAWPSILLVPSGGLVLNCTSRHIPVFLCVGLLDKGAIDLSVCILFSVFFYDKCRQSGRQTYFEIVVNGAQ